MKNKLAFLLLTNRHDRKLFNFYCELKENTAAFGDLYILYHQTKNKLPKWIKRCTNYSFSYDSLTELEYIPLRQTLVPGSNHFPVLEFFLRNTDYNFYWCIEDDVRFNGSWSYFFNDIDKYEHDFLSCHVTRYRDEPGWSWWNTLGHPEKQFQISDRIKSFNPIYRISGAALQYIHCALKDKWFGHHEVLFPTLLYHKGFTIGDFGGEGEFAIPTLVNQFYTDEFIEENITISTVRWRPIMKSIGNRSNKLYHPVKE